jgi:hypothetical protein
MRRFLTGPSAWRRQTGLAAVALVLWCTAATAAGPATAPTRAEEDAVKVAFLFNFAKFVQWPQPSNGPLLVCVVAEGEFAELVSRLVRGNTVDSRELTARQLKESDDPADCEMLFVSALRQKQSVEMLQRARGPILTVGETVQFMRDGGMVRLFVEDNRLRFQINQRAAEATGLKVSSKLLTLSR